LFLFFVLLLSSTKMFIMHSVHRSMNFLCWHIFTYDGKVCWFAEANLILLLARSARLDWSFLFTLRLCIIHDTLFLHCLFLTLFTCHVYRKPIVSFMFGTVFSQRSSAGVEWQLGDVPGPDGTDVNNAQGRKRTQTPDSHSLSAHRPSQTWQICQHCPRRQQRYTALITGGIG